MLKIAVCDDELISQDQLITDIEEICKDLDFSFCIDRFFSAESFLESYRFEDRYDLVFLDIYMSKLNGMECAKKIREIDLGIKIAFVTSSPDFVFEGYNVNAMDYLLKPISLEKLKEIIVLTKNHTLAKKNLSVKINNQIKSVLYSDIIYVESHNKKVFISTVEEEFEVYSRLSDIYKHLPESLFVHCHKSYIVSLKYVSQLTSKSLKLKTGIDVPVSRANLESTKLRFMNYLSLH